MNVLFVCLGNICRSPTAEGVFKTFVEKKGLSKNFFIDSAGTSAYHVGEKADHRMRKAAAKRGYNLTSLSRKLEKKDLNDFEYILAMDESNYNDILGLDISGQFKNKIKLINDFSLNYINNDVTDPYYGGPEGFDNVITILEESCNGFLNFLIENNEV